MPDSRPREPGAVERLLNGTLLALTCAYFALVLWQQVDADADPRRLVDDVRERVRDRLRERRGMADTLADIQDLPELADDDAGA